MHLDERQNCWRVADASRVAFLVDGEAYFRAVADAFEMARYAIYIIGWDIDSRTRLRRGKDGTGEPLGKFLDRLARERPEISIYLLEWDFAMLYSLERETWPLLSLGWQTHERVRFALDDAHPVGASHHQKIVVIDDTVAFVGGFDLTRCRWDTSEHAPQQAERLDSGETYGPFHDVQMMVAGSVAAELAVLVRQRWERATGDELRGVVQSATPPWPEHIQPDLEDVPVGILRTAPEYDGEAEIREIERFYTEAIDQAANVIYIENQYLTSDTIGSVLEKVLSRPKGPEVLLVLPRECSGWLEEETMGALRSHLIQRLLRADHHKRLKVCYPHRADLGSSVINVHSKVMVVDDNLLTIGSANISNRSMGLDTECNLAMVAGERHDVAQAIAGFRNRLLAEHLGVDPECLSQSQAETGSLLAAVEALNEGARRLETLMPKQAGNLAGSLSANMIADPERPIGLEKLLDYFGFNNGSQDETIKLRKKAWRFGLAVAGASILAVLWRWSPLGELLDIDHLITLADTLRQSELTVPFVLAIYVVGCCIMFPVTLLLLATALSFGPYLGFSLALGGSLLGGLASYLLGRWLGRDVVRKLAGEKVNRLSRKLARRGFLAIALVRIVPIAPYTIVNMVAGATHISTRSFLLGTAVGMGPGILAIMLFEGGLEHALREPGWMSLGIAAIAVVCGVLVLLIGKRWLLRQEKKRDA